MTPFDRELFLLAPLALGLMALGALGLIAGRVPPAWRLGVAGLLVAGCYAALGTLVPEGDPLSSPARPLEALVATAVGVAALQLRLVSRLTRLLERPGLASAACVILGVASLAAAVVRHDFEVDATAARDLDAIPSVPSAHDRIEVTDVRATTDRGRPVPVSRCKSPRPLAVVDADERRRFDQLEFSERAIRRQPASDDCNCHGWVFAGGRYIVPGDAVPHILEDNGYVATPTASPGDLVVYRGAAGDVLHTAVVRYVAAGRPPMVEGKWGWMGVYLHAADASVYGTNYTFYRAARDGDTLHGIDGTVAPIRFSGAE